MTTEDELGTIQVILDRLTKQRLPRALEIKSRVDQGECLGDIDIRFMKEIFDEAHSVSTLLAHHPEFQKLAAHVVSLYHDITAKALENEKNRGGSKQ